MYATVLHRGEGVSFRAARGRHVYVHVARGEIEVNGVALRAGDGVRIVDDEAISLDGSGVGEALLFDLP